MDVAIKKMKIDDLDNKFVKGVCFLLGIRNWETISETQRTNIHYYLNKVDKSKSSERNVKDVVILQKCKYTGLTRGQILYGDGSLFKDEIISGEKAKLIIEGKL